MIEFDWDEANINHIARHGVVPHEAEEVLGLRALDLGTRSHKGEQRITLLGVTNAGRILVVVFTLRGAKVRVVTSYPADRRYRRFYLEQTGGTDHEGI